MSQRKRGRGVIPPRRLKDRTMTAISATTWPRTTPTTPSLSTRSEKRMQKNISAARLACIRLDSVIRISPRKSPFRKRRAIEVGMVRIPSKNATAGTPSRRGPRRRNPVTRQRSIPAPPRRIRAAVIVRNSGLAVDRSFRPR